MKVPRYAVLISVIALLAGWSFIAPVRGFNPPQVNQTGTTSATFRFSPAGAVLDVGQVVTLTVEVTDAQDLGGFQFDLNYDSSMINIENMGLGSFLGSTSRTPGILGPQIDHHNGQAIMGGYSYAPPQTAGAAGTGPIAWVRLRKIAGGASELSLTRTMLVNTQAQLQASTGSTVIIAPRIAWVQLPLVLKNFSD